MHPTFHRGTSMMYVVVFLVGALCGAWSWHKMLQCLQILHPPQPPHGGIAPPPPPQPPHGGIAPPPPPQPQAASGPQPRAKQGALHRDVISQSQVSFTVTLKNKEHRFQPLGANGNEHLGAARTLSRGMGGTGRHVEVSVAGGCARRVCEWPYGAGLDCA